MKGKHIWQAVPEARTQKEAERAETSIREDCMRTATGPAKRSIQRLLRQALFAVDTVEKPQCVTMPDHGAMN